MGFAASCRVSDVPPCFRPALFFLVPEHLEPRQQRVLEKNFLLQGFLGKIKRMELSPFTNAASCQ